MTEIIWDSIERSSRRQRQKSFPKLNFDLSFASWFASGTGGTNSVDTEDRDVVDVGSHTECTEVTIAGLELPSSNFRSQASHRHVQAPSLPLSQGRTDMPTSSIRCKYFARGYCKYGENCKYSHARTAMTKAAPPAQNARSSCQEMLNQALEVDEQLAREGGFWERMQQRGLVTKRKNLVVRMHVAAQVIRTRITRIDELIEKSAPSEASWFPWQASQEKDSLLRVERQVLEPQLQEFGEALEALGAQGDDVPEEEVSKALQQLENIPVGSSLWTSLVAFVNERSRNSVSHYKFEIDVKCIWHVPLNDTLNAMQQQAMRLGEPVQLFHGSSPQHCANIMSKGFGIPNHRGMFGAGLYFAESPLKSVQYAQKSKSGGFLKWLGQMFGTSKEHDFGGSQMLICDVYLGRSKTVRSAWPGIDPITDLSGGTFSNALGLGDYHSVYAPGGKFAAVWVTEYVVYQPYQAIPRYLIEFDVKR